MAKKRKAMKKAAPYIETATGRLVHPLDFEEDEVDIRDIAISLSRVPRFAGHCPRTVLEHSIDTAKLYKQLYGSAPHAHPVFGVLMHDASEAYLLDIPRPLKREMPQYRKIEARVQEAIEKHFGLSLSTTDHEYIKHCDNIVLGLEAAAFMPSRGKALRNWEEIREDVERLRSLSATSTYWTFEAFEPRDRLDLVAEFYELALPFLESNQDWMQAHKDTFLWIQDSVDMYHLRQTQRRAKREKELSTPVQGGGKRYDKGKVRVDLVPPSLIAMVAAVLERNAKPWGKYDPWNWEKGMPWSKCWGPAMRHLMEWLDGVKEDPEDGLPPLWHCLCDLAFLAHYELHGLGTDDRPAARKESALALVKRVLDELRRREESMDVKFTPNAKGSDPCTVPYIASSVDEAVKPQDPGPHVTFTDAAEQGDPSSPDVSPGPEDTPSCK